MGSNEFGRGASVVMVGLISGRDFYDVQLSASDKSTATTLPLHLFAVEKKMSPQIEPPL